MLTIVFGTAVMIGLISPVVHAQSYYPVNEVGHDVSWPNCQVSAPKDKTFGIVGITGGLVFRPNPCLFEEAHWFQNLSLYLNTGYVGKTGAEKYATSPRNCSSSDEACLAYNFGYNAAAYALNYAASQYVHTNVWWLDVETDNSWSTNTDFNRASLQGMIGAITQYTILPTIGFYSYPGQWDSITNSWKNGYPNWAATGSSDFKQAVSYCQGQDFNGGRTWLTQYTTRLDNDYACGPVRIRGLE
jgi:hypothetical protein